MTTEPFNPGDSTDGAGPDPDSAPGPTVDEDANTDGGTDAGGINEDDPIDRALVGKPVDADDDAS